MPPEVPRITSQSQPAAPSGGTGQGGVRAGYDGHKGSSGGGQEREKEPPKEEEEEAQGSLDGDSFAAHKQKRDLGNYLNEAMPWEGQPTNRLTGALGKQRAPQAPGPGTGTSRLAAARNAAAQPPQPPAPSVAPPGLGRRIDGGFDTGAAVNNTFLAHQSVRERQAEVERERQAQQAAQQSSGPQSPSLLNRSTGALPIEPMRPSMEPRTAPRAPEPTTPIDVAPPAAETPATAAPRAGLTPRANTSSLSGGVPRKPEPSIPRPVEPAAGKPTGPVGSNDLIAAAADAAKPPKAPASTTPPGMRSPSGALRPLPITPAAAEPAASPPSPPAAEPVARTPITAPVSEPAPRPPVAPPTAPHAEAAQKRVGFICAYRILDAGSGDPLKGARVEFEPVIDGQLPNVHGEVDLHGWYCSAEVPSGHYQVTVRCAGYIPQTQTRYLSADDVDEGTFLLRRP